MILSYGFKNYFGFKEGAEVSFALNSRVPKDISFGRDVATILGIKGANGAGKTNLLKALCFVFDFAATSFRKEPGSEIEADPYFDSTEPSEFYINFKIKETFYFYELGVTPKKVAYERLSRKVISTDKSDKKTRKVLVFDRINNDIVKRIDEISDVDVISLRSNVSLISAANNYKFTKPLTLMEDVHEYFKRFISNVYYTGLSDFSVDSDSIHRISEYYSKITESFEFVKNIIINSDLGICDVVIRDRLDDKGNKVYFPIFYHCVEDKKHALTIYDQSSGTRSLFVKLQKYWYVLTYGGVLVLDEFDLNCHPFMLPKLLDLFESTQTNPLSAQFIFTSHITEVLDKLGKYRTYLVNKDCNESYCYRLDEIGGDLLRHGRPISPIYNDGKIGGVPKI